MPIVVAEESMDDATLIKHVNARHMPIAGLQRVTVRDSDPGEKLLRQYHQHCHHRGYDDNAPGRPCNHSHAD